MKRIKILLYACLFIAVLAVVLGLVFTRRWQGAVVPIILGGFWALSLRQNWRIVPSASAVLLLLFASMDQDLGSTWLWIGLLSAFVAWDLSYFWWDLQQAQIVYYQDEIERQHLIRVFSIVGLSIALFILTNLLDLQLRFGWVLVLGLILIFGLSRAIVMIRESLSE